MHYFPMLMFQHWALAFFLGLAAVILTCLAFGLTRHEPQRGQNLDELNKDRGSHLNLFAHFFRNPHGLYLLLVYLGIVMFFIAYYFLVGLGARAIW
jgi:uncharacterized membrane protein YedE/YeeE